jgi:hypothetical protein
MLFSLKPFNGIRVPSNSQLNSERKAYSVLDKVHSQFHQEALPSLYLYLEKEETGKLQYIGLIGLIKENNLRKDNFVLPAIWKSETIDSHLSDILKPWMEHPEIEFSTQKGQLLQLGVIQSFQRIQEIIDLVQKCNWTCLDSSQHNNPFVCLSLNPDLLHYSYFPVGLLSLPPDYAENTSPFSTGF